MLFILLSMDSISDFVDRVIKKDIVINKQEIFEA